MEKIQILLIDDQPVHWYDEIEERVVLPPEMVDLFEVYWLKDIAQCKAFLELYNLIKASNPKLLSSLSLPPDILIFDYALTQSSSKFSQLPGDETNPVASLRSFAQQLNLASSVSEDDWPDISCLPGEDKFGCFVGTTFTQVFSGHPCGSVPTTAALDISESDDVKFFQWFNEPYFGELFNVKSRTQPDIQTLLPIALEQLRNRFIELTANNLITPDTNDLMKILNYSDDELDGRIRFVTSLGAREMPVRSLFFDGLSEANDNNLDAAPIWAQEVLDAMIKEGVSHDIEPALELAEAYMQRFEAEEEESEDRHNLSKLLHRPYAKLRNYEKDQLDLLCDKFGFNLDNLLANPSSHFFDGGSLPPIWQNTSDGNIKRWSVLIACILVEVRYARSNSDDSRQIQNKTQREMWLRVLNPLPKSPYSEGYVATGLKRSVRVTPTSVFKHSPSNINVKGGVEAGEGSILRRLAQQRGLNERDFPLWLKHAPE